MEQELSELWLNLRLTEEEEEKGIQVEAETFYQKKSWSPNCLLGKLLSKKHFNRLALKNTMSLTWKEWGLRKVEELNDNLFMFHFRKKEDRDLIISNGPWNFNNKLLMLKPLERGETPSEIIFRTVQIWVQIHDLPLQSMTKQMGEEVSRMFGKIYETKTDMEGYGIGASLRIRVDLRLDKPLLRRAKIEIGREEVKWIYFKYERLPIFCHVCGILGHQDKECPEAFKQRKDAGEVSLQYGNWLRVVPGFREPKNPFGAPPAQKKEGGSSQVVRHEPQTSTRRVRREEGASEPNSDGEKAEPPRKDKEVTTCAVEPKPNHSESRGAETMGAVESFLTPISIDNSYPPNTKLEGVEKA